MKPNPKRLPVIQVPSSNAGVEVSQLPLSEHVSRFGRSPSPAASVDTPCRHPTGALAKPLAQGALNSGGDGIRKRSVSPAPQPPTNSGAVNGKKSVLPKNGGSLKRIRDKKFIRIYPIAVQVMLDISMPERIATSIQLRYPSTFFFINNQTFRYGLMFSNFFVEKYSKGAVLQSILDISYANDLLPSYATRVIHSAIGDVTAVDLVFAGNLFYQSRMYALPYTTHLLFDKVWHGHDYLELTLELALTVFLIKATIASAGLFSLATVCTLMSTVPHLEVDFKQAWYGTVDCISDKGLSECTSSAAHQLQTSVSGVWDEAVEAVSMGGEVLHFAAPW